MVIMDKEHFCSIKIDTDKWLKATLGEPLEDFYKSGHQELPLTCEDTIEGICGWIGTREKASGLLKEGDYYLRTNVVYLEGQDHNLDEDFSYVIFYPYMGTTNDDYLHGYDIYIAVEGRDKSQPTRLYRLDKPADTGFFTPVLGFWVTACNGSKVDDALERQLDEGYSGYPMQKVEDMLDNLRFVTFGDKSTWVGDYDGTPLEITPYAAAAFN